MSIYVNFSIVAQSKDMLVLQPDNISVNTGKTIIPLLLIFVNDLFNQIYFLIPALSGHIMLSFRFSDKILQLIHRKQIKNYLVLTSY